MSPPWFSRLTIALALACIGAGARAQEVDASYYDGTWTARLPCREGAGVCSARLVIADFAGTWQDLAGKRAAKRLCGGKKMPVTVQSSTHSQLAFTVFGDGVSPGCPTLSVFVKPVDEKTLDGSVAAGRYASEPPGLHAGPAEAPPTALPGTTEDGASAAAPIRLQRR